VQGGEGEERERKAGIREGKGGDRKAKGEEGRAI